MINLMKLKTLVCFTNFGNQPATFPVTMLIGASYSQTISESLAAGGSDTAVFPQWIAEPVGVTSATGYTALAAAIHNSE